MKLKQYPQRDAGNYGHDSRGRHIIRINWVNLVDGDPESCFFPNCRDKATDTHHVTYNAPPAHPYGFQVRLCCRHHEEITVINCNTVEGKYRKLTNDERTDAFRRWTNGSLEPKYTPQAVAWVEKMWKPAVAA